MCYKKTLLYILLILAIVLIMRYENTSQENFYGGYFESGYPYDFPFPLFYPFYYSGCNENVFGEVMCAQPMI